MSFSLTGPLTFLTIVLVVSSKNSTRTWVTPPREPVRPRTLITLARVTGVLVSIVFLINEFEFVCETVSKTIDTSLRLRSPKYTTTRSNSSLSTKVVAIGKFFTFRRRRNFPKCAPLWNRGIKILKILCVCHFVRVKDFSICGYRNSSQRNRHLYQR